MNTNMRLKMVTVQTTEDDRLRELATNGDEETRREARREIARRARNRNRETYEKLAHE